MKILGIAGSLRKGSWNKKLLKNAVEILEKEGHEVEVFDLGGIVPYNFDVEQQGFPEYVKQMRERILGAGAIVLSSPEYNHSVSGVLKNAIDWASRDPNVLDGKSVAIMGASDGGFGTVRAQQHLRNILMSTNCWVIPQPQMLLSRAQDAFDENDRLKDEKKRETLRKLMRRLVEFSNRIK